MSGSAQSDGIAQLQRAEREAADKINEARKRKAKRLKQAKDEAKKEIENFKNECERDYKLHEQQTVGSKSEFEKKMQEETDEKLRALENAVRINKERALQKLLEQVCDIQPKLHVNYKQNHAA